MAPTKRKAKEVAKEKETSKDKKKDDETIDLTERIIELKALIDKAYKELLPTNKLMIDLSVRKKSNAELYVEQIKSKEAQAALFIKNAAESPTIYVANVAQKLAKYYTEGGTRDIITMVATEFEFIVFCDLVLAEKCKVKMQEMFDCALDNREILILLYYATQQEATLDKASGEVTLLLNTIASKKFTPSSFLDDYAQIVVKTKMYEESVKKLYNSQKATIFDMMVNAIRSKKKKAQYKSVQNEEKSMEKFLQLLEQDAHNVKRCLDNLANTCDREHDRDESVKEPQSKKPKLSDGLREGKSTSSGKGDINDIAAQINANTLCFNCGEYGHASKKQQGDKTIKCRNKQKPKAEIDKLRQTPTAIAKETERARLIATLKAKKDTAT